MKTYNFVLRVSFKFGRIGIRNRSNGKASSLQNVMAGETTYHVDCVFDSRWRPRFSYDRVASYMGNPASAAVAAIRTARGTVITTGERAQ